ncbi:MAG: glycosyltransferase family 4 protein [Paludibacteraceae bacterium]|nr:glycosyltransferase family 4 protein [Paludibacteraceae bacterium]
MSERKKIAFVGNSALTMLNFRLGVMTELNKEYDVVMITPEDCDVSVLKQLGIRFIPVIVDCKGRNPFRDLSFLHMLRQIYHREQFDFVFHYTIKPILYGALSASKLGIRHIEVVTGLGYSFIKRNWLYYLSCVMHRLALRKTDGVWFLNQDDCDAFVKWKLVQQKYVHVIHGEGVNTSYFQSHQPMPDTFTFLHCGRMLRSKGVALYVQAAERLRGEFPQVHFQLLGPLDAQNPDAIDPIEMETWVRSGVVEYLGVTKDVRPYLERCSCMVLPSYYMEGVPRSLMEAASMERPIIATDSVGCKDVVLDGVNGILCEKRSLHSLVDAMRKMLSLSDEQRIKMGKDGRELMLRKFDEQIVLREYASTLHNALN